MKTAVVGLGYWGPKLLRNLIELIGAERVVAVDQNISRMDEVSSRYPSVGLELSLDAALADDTVSSVLIATPVESHYRLARQAIRSGRHVFVEKPLAGNVRDASDLVFCAADAGVQLMVGHTFLFSPRVQYITDYVASGKLGKVQYASSSRLNLGLHRSDASVIWDLAPHDFSILFQALGESPIMAQTTARGGRRPDLPEVAFINLSFPSGAVASVAVSWLAPRKIRKTLIVGEDQMIEYDDSRNDEPIKVFDTGIATPDSPDFGEHQLTYRYGDTVAPYVAPTEPLSLQLAHFLECIETGERCASDGVFGLRVVEALAAAEQSWKRGGYPVEIEPVDAVLAAALPLL